MAEELANYTILEQLAAGGRGVVYVALDQRLARRVAIKVVRGDLSSDESSRRELEREARVAASISHPHVCTIHEVGRTAGGDVFVVMEYFPRGSLAGKRLAIRETVRIGIQVADALAAAHGRGIVHRDIKPGNIVATETGHAKVVDFGLASISLSHAFAPAESSSGRDRIGVIAGTLHYMSPEQIRGETLDGRSDLFSLAVTLYELGTGQLPFHGRTAEEVRRSICCDEPARPSSLEPSIPASFEAALAIAMRKEARDRYASAATMKLALERVARGLDTGSGVGSDLSDRTSLHPAVASATTNALPRSPAPRHRQRLVVLPIENIAGADDQALCDGLVATLASALSQVDAIRESYSIVSMANVRERGASTPAAARRECNAELVMAATFQRAGREVRVTMDLVDAESGETLRSLVLTEDDRGVLPLQDAIIEKVVPLLASNEMTAADRSMVCEGTTDEPRAHTFYLQAIGFLRRYEDPRAIDSAIERLEQALGSDPQFPLAHAAMGEAYWRRFEDTGAIRWSDLAEAHCRKSIELGAELSPVRMTLAMIARGRGHIEEALRELEAAREREPRSSSLHRRIGRISEDMSRHTHAELAYRKAVLLDPESWEAVNALGLFFYRRGRYPEALHWLQTLTRLIPESSWGYNNLASVYFALGRLDDARASLESAFRARHGQDYMVAANLGTLLWNEGRNAEAVGWYERALSLNDRDFRVWGDLGFALDALGESDRARTCFRRATQGAEAQLTMTPDDSVLLALLANYAALLGDHAAARKRMAEVGNAGGVPQTEYLLACAWEELGDRSRALEGIVRALTNGLPRSNIECNPRLAALRADPRWTGLGIPGALGSHGSGDQGGRS